MLRRRQRDMHEFHLPSDGRQVLPGAVPSAGGLRWFDSRGCLDESRGWRGAEKCTPKPWVLNQSCFSFGKGRSGEKGIFSECCEWASRILKNHTSCQINIDNCCQTIRNLFSIGNRVDVPLLFVRFLILFVLQHVYSIDTWYHGILIYYISSYLFIIDGQPSLHIFHLWSSIAPIVTAVLAVRLPGAIWTWRLQLWDRSQRQRATKTHEISRDPAAWIPNSNAFKMDGGLGTSAMSMPRVNLLPLWILMLEGIIKTISDDSYIPNRNWKVIN